MRWVQVIVKVVLDFSNYLRCNDSYVCTAVTDLLQEFQHER
jgi:hypothetical protein